MVEADREQRQLMLQKALDGADDELFQWAGHRVFCEAKIRLLQMPWDVEHPATVYVGKKIVPTTFADTVDKKTASPTKKQAVYEVPPNFGKIDQPLADLMAMAKGPSLSDLKVQPFNKNLSDTLIHMNSLLGLGYKKWMSTHAAPIVKKKAYNPLSLHIPKNALVLVKKVAHLPKEKDNLWVAQVKSFTKNYVKIVRYTAFGNVLASVPYNMVEFVAV